MEQFENNGKLELSPEEIILIRERREKARSRDTISPPGIGTGRIWTNAKLKKKVFLDEATFIEKHGKR